MISQNKPHNKLNNLLSKYKNVCDEIANVFCEKHDFHNLSTPFSWFVKGNVLFCNEDFCFDFETILMGLEMNASDKDLMEWYDYSLESTFNDETYINYENWLKMKYSKD